jgi:hypothetical protein
VVVAVTVTSYVPKVVGEPVIRPEVLITRPGGRPVAVKVKTAPGAMESAAWICSGGILVLAMYEYWCPGLVTVTVPAPVTGGVAAVAVMLQEKLAIPVAPALGVTSVAVTVTAVVAWTVGVPVIRPAVLIDKPVGRPAAVKVKVAPAALESAAAICTGAMAVLVTLARATAGVTVMVPATAGAADAEEDRTPASSIPDPAMNRKTVSMRRRIISPSLPHSFGAAH